jgi:hypothetical protein
LPAVATASKSTEHVHGRQLPRSPAADRYEADRGRQGAVGGRELERELGQARQLKVADIHDLILAKGSGVDQVALGLQQAAAAGGGGGGVAVLEVGDVQHRAAHEGGGVVG